jgi:plastocyanin
VSLVAACGGGTGSPSGPGGNPGGAPGPSGATITISNGRVNPSEVTVTVGQSVTFVNNDGRTQNVSSDPHPVHTDCTEINVVGNLSNNQSRLTNAFMTPRSCGFHNHDFPDDANLKGRINIQ